MTVLARLNLVPAQARSSRVEQALPLDRPQADAAAQELEELLRRYVRAD